MANHVVVAGGAGFLGSHVTDRLIQDQGVERVFCIDNLQTGSQQNIRHLSGNNRFEFINKDIIEAPEIPANEIWNFACAASPAHYQADPIHTFKTSVFGSYNLAENAIKHGAKLFHTSTSEVYGDPLLTPQSESYWGNVNPVGLRSCYDEGKRAAETLLVDLHRTNQLDLRLVRIFNTYGPRMAPDDGRVVSNFIVQALKGEPLTIYGDGQQTRSFCYVDDLIDVCQLMMRQEKHVGPVNIGNPGEFTIIELAEIILRLTGSSSKLDYHDLPSDDPQQRRPDISLAKNELGWSPKVDLLDGLAETISYFKHQLSCQ